jgi:alginate O-acetyltransferase complex protein AlgJ
MPEAFAGRLPCSNTSAARTQFLPDYVRILREGGIAVTDTASLIHSLKGKFAVDLFPQGGVHWNEIGRNEAAKLVVQDINSQIINRQAAKPLLPSFAYTYSISNTARGTDRELIDVINVLFPALSYPVPVTSLQPQASCASHPAHELNAVAIGSSFLHAPAEVLISAACLTKLNVYFYMSLSRHGGMPYHPLQQNLTQDDLAPLKTADIVILEENESFAGKASYIDRLRDLLIAGEIK